MVKRAESHIDAMGIRKWLENRKIKRLREKMREVARLEIRRSLRETTAVLGRQTGIATINSKLAVLLPAVERNKRAAIEELEKPNPDIKVLNRAEIVLAEAISDLEGAVTEYKNYCKSKSRYTKAKLAKEDIATFTKGLKATIELIKQELREIKQARKERGL